MPVDLMLVNDETFEKLLAGSDWQDFAGHLVRVASVLHLIALKLHALRSPDRGLTDQDFLDILNLIRLHSIDVKGKEFQEILDRYATPAIRERLFRDL